MEDNLENIITVEVFSHIKQSLELGFPDLQTQIYFDSQALYTARYCTDFMTLGILKLQKSFFVSLFELPLSCVFLLSQGGPVFLELPG